MRIQSNLAALNAQRQLGMVRAKKNQIMQQLSSGYSINRAADNAAGLSISEKMRSQIRALNQTLDNLQDGISMVQIADGAMAEVQDMLNRTNELAVKSANETNTDVDREAIQKEVAQINAEINRIGWSTEFNTRKILLSEEEQNADGPLDLGVLEFSPDSKFDDPGGNSKTIDFSKATTENLEKLDGAEYSFVCDMGCEQEFTFRFSNSVDNTGPNYTNGIQVDKEGSLTASRPENNVELTIDINAFSDGQEIIEGIYDYMKNRADAAIGADGKVKVGHANSMNINGGKLTIYGTRSGAAEFKCNQKMVDLLQSATPLNLAIQAGTHGNKESLIPLKMPLISSYHVGTEGLDVSTKEGAKRALAQIQTCLSYVSGERSRMGAYQNRMEHAYRNNGNIAENTTAAESAIRDTNMAGAVADFSKENILEQAGQAMLSQANQSREGILQLLQ